MLVEGLYSLKDKTYEYITIASSVGDGSVKLENVHIIKDLIINGGGSHTITLDGCSVDGTTMVDADTTPRINLVNGCELSTIVVAADVILDSEDGNGSFGTVTATSAVVTINAGAVVENIAMNGGTADVKGEVSTITQTGGEVTITGEGSVDTFNANGTAVIESSVVSTVVVAEDVSETNLSVTGTETVDVKVNASNVTITTSQDSDVNVSTDLENDPVVTVDGEVFNHFHKYEFLRFQWDEVRYTCEAVLVCPACDESEPGHLAYERIRLSISGINPTCTEDGYTEYTAVFGNESDSRRQVIPALGHDLVDHEGKVATCTEPGYAAYHTCSRCDYTDYEEIPALRHDLIHVEAKVATMMEGGHNAYDYCTRCDYSTKVVTPPLGINIYVYGGTPFAEGYALSEVSGMGAVKCLVVDKNTVVTISPDTVAGRTFHEWSSDRGDTIGVESFTLLAETDTYIFANYEENLVFGDWVVVSTPDCAKTGSAYRETSDGFRQYAVLYPANPSGYDGHRPVNEVLIKSPTCTEEGIVKAECADCGVEYTYAVEALGHYLDDGTIIKEAEGAVIGQKEYRCTRDGCDYSVVKDYIKPILPSGEFNIYMTTETHDSGWPSNFDRFEWHTSTVNSEGKSAYLYIFTALNLKEDTYPAYSILLWIDEGEHSPVYVKHGNQYTLSESYGNWGIIEYCDTYADFIEYLDSASKGGDNGYTNSLLYDLFNYYADGLNAEWFLEREDPNGDRYYVDKEDISVPGYQTLLVDSNNCVWVYTMEGGTYNRVERAVPYLVPSEEDRENYSCQVFNRTFYPYRLIESVKERSEVTYFQETLIDNGTASVRDHNRDDTFHYMNNVIGSFDLSHTVIHNYRFVEYQIQGLDGNWYYLANEDHQDVIDVGSTRCYTIRDIYDALSQKYGTEVFVPVTDARFDNIHLRGYYEEIPPQCEFTLVNATTEMDGETVTSGRIHLDENLYIESDRISGKVLSGWKVTKNGSSDTQNANCDLFYAFHEAGTYVIEAIYQDDSFADVEISVIGDGFVYYDGSIFTEKTVHGYLNDILMIQPVNGYGSRFVGWKIDYRDGDEGGEIVERNMEDIYGPLRDQKQLICSVSEFRSVTAVFDDDLDYYDAVATNGFVMNTDYKLDGINGYKVSNLRVYYSNQYNLMLGLVSDPNKETALAWDITEEGEETHREFVWGGEQVTITYIEANTTYDGVFAGDLRTYTVSFDGDEGASGTMSDIIVREDDSSVKLPANGFEKEGYNFRYWTDGNSTYAPGEYAYIEADTIFTAVWKIDVSYAEFHVDAWYSLYHLTQYDVSVTYGETENIPADVLQYAYGFRITGWYDPVSDVTYPADGTGQLPYGVKDLYAVIDYDEVTLHFIKGSESVRGTMDDLVVRVGADEKAVIPEGAGVFSNPGYMFAGWYVDGSPFGYDIDEFSLVTIFRDMGASDGDVLELTAQWEVLTIHVRYTADSSAGEAWVYAPASTISIDMPSFTFYGIMVDGEYTIVKPGSELASWNTRKDGSGMTIELDQTVTEVADLLEAIGEYLAYDSYGYLYLNLYPIWA